MKTIRVKDLMVPLPKYGTVSQDATLHEAFEVMEKAYEESRHRAILVLGENDRIVGKLNRLDLLGALEPKYQDIGDMRSVSASGFSPRFIQSMLSNYRLWQSPSATSAERGPPKR